jgi:hypothetical protein
MQDEMKITIIATGFENEPSQYADINKEHEDGAGEEDERSDEDGDNKETLVDFRQLEEESKGDVASDREDSWRKTLEDLQKNTPAKTNFDIPSFLK